MEEEPYVEITDIRPDSIADELDIESGDKLLRINDQQIRDYIDYRFLSTDLYLELLIRKKNGEEWLYEIEKDYDEDLGLEFSSIIYDGLKKCNNNCIFCFVDQSPAGLRETLNLKDDDYRFSFLQGSYITLTNLAEEEINRIKRLHLSPLYVSVHTTDPELRVRMMHNKKAGDILPKLRELVEAGIEFHTQIVLCPEINDGQELDRTIENLIELTPAVRSLAIVPVGLTEYRSGLYSLRSFTAQEAEEVIEQVAKWQEKLAQRGENFIYLADEFYLLADRELPAVEDYNGFVQLENGVGMIRLFWQQFEEAADQLPASLNEEADFTLITGELGAEALRPVIDRLNEIEKLSLNLLIVENKFFGSQVTVTGLLAGEDIIKAIEEAEVADKIVLPAVLLNDDDLFIDDLKLSDLENRFPQLEFILVDNDAENLVNRLMNI
ncbi:DUF512 domain-containing protein [Acetohalobium arabaticum]|uniref:PDZ domain-containing protein n=1 Tax=Acetohalobium arabaticum (strain ATCC 49924 / DSM 5501 / Z-7288) TaxID=574087 RepID=D9QPX9_ACEAZ|nr:DUF512 domain-containing protein [Acetohalobium arabaticum]ADL12570.1 protein of unknown function DUF512 [Acetohalobium arabaticum DSM 5501]